MRKRKTNRRKSRVIPHILVLLLVTLLASSCAFKQPEEVIWHQQYRAIDNRNTDHFVKRNLAAAIAAFGSSITPITEHHIRQSVPRSDYDKIRQADVLDWPLLATKILSYRDCLQSLSGQLPSSDPRLTSLQEISKGRTPFFSERQDVISIINSIILAQTSIREQALSCLQHDPQPSPSLLKQLHLKKMPTNRETISTLFSPAILPAPQKKRAQKGLEICEIVDERKGVFILYLSVPEEDKAFHAQLSHETFHMLNPYLFDWYMEGLCNVFAEEMATKLGFPWEKMKRHLESKRHKDPYAIAYYIMKELKEVCGRDLHTILQFTTWADAAQTRMHIDINAWLNSLPNDTQQAAIRIITKSSKMLKKHQGRHNIFTPVRLDQFSTH